MADSDRQRIARTLQSEANQIARLAAQDLSLKWSAGTPPAESFMRAFRVPSGQEGKELGPRTWDEMLSMMSDGYVRLGGIVSLALLVEEPGLISDDLDWLKQRFATGMQSLGHETWLQELLGSYLAGCEALLAPKDASLVSETIEQALAITAE